MLKTFWNLPIYNSEGRKFESFQFCENIKFRFEFKVFVAFLFCEIFFYWISESE